MACCCLFFFTLFGTTCDSSSQALIHTHWMHVQGLRFSEHQLYAGSVPALCIRPFPHHNQLPAHFTDEGEES